MAMTSGHLEAAIKASILSSKDDPDLNIFNDPQVTDLIRELLLRSGPLINAVNHYWDNH